MRSTTITLVHTPACHLCADAEAALTDLGRQVPLEIDLVPADSDAGQALIATHRPAMFPLILADGEFVSAGRLPRGKLRGLLAARALAGRS